MFRRMLFAALLVFALPVQAGDLEDLQTFFKTVQSLRGEFTQTTLDEQGRVLEESTGTLQIQRPGKFRWFYQQPFEQLIVADGEDLWVYDVDLDQVTVRPLDDVLGLGPALLLSGSYQSLEDNFDIEEIAEGWLALAPRDSDWEFQSIRVLMRDGMPAVIDVDSGLGQSTVLELSALERNPKLDSSVFEFTPPPGVDVIAPTGSGYNVRPDF